MKIWYTVFCSFIHSLVLRPGRNKSQIQGEMSKRTCNILTFVRHWFHQIHQFGERRSKGLVGCVLFLGWFFIPSGKNKSEIQGGIYQRACTMLRFEHCCFHQIHQFGESHSADLVDWVLLPGWCFIMSERDVSKIQAQHLFFVKALG